MSGTVLILLLASEHAAKKTIAHNCQLKLCNSHLKRISLTGIVSQAMVIETSLSENCMYDKVILQLLGTAGTAKIQDV